MSAEGDLSGPDGGWNHGFAALDDLTMHYVREGAGTPLVLLHGWPEFWWAWHRNIPVLGQHFDVIAPDLRGFGRTKDIGGEPPDADAHARDVIALADALGLDRFGLVAHDVGAYAAQQIARRWPERLTGVFLFNAPYPGIGRRWADAAHIPEIWYQSFNQLPWAAELVGHDRETCRIYFGNMLRHWAFRKEAADAEVEHFVDNFMQPGNLEGGFAWYRATHEARMALVRDGAPALPKIGVQTRFYWGRHDPVIPSAWMDRLPDYFVDPIMEIAEEAGHFVHFEQPAEANRRIADFFGSRS